MIFRHYRELVKPKDADRYWKVAPAAAREKARPVHERNGITI